ncbi:MAG TPA: hypothetical protein VK828_09540 [Terriglobales bacterium]|nr:hypothetical protein [Terriglobales bacterium]
MSRINSIFAVLLLTAVVCIVPQAHAAITIEASAAGSSGAWQAFGVGTYNYCVKTYGAGNCFHWTSSSNNVFLTDTRVTPVNNDGGTLWVVWEVASGNVAKMWSDDKIDSTIGNRCFFAQPQCTVDATAATLTASGSSQISASIWGADTNLPAPIQAIFEAGTPVTVLLSDTRPEDAAFEDCRVNSALGNGPYGAGGHQDGMDGMGYNSSNQPGVCPGSGLPQGNYVGASIKSGYPASTATANPLSFNITGNDPISGTKIPAYTVIELGAQAIMFFFERDKGQLTNLANVSPEQLQQAFSGTNCDASAFGLPAGSIGIFLREPLSGTMTGVELTTFRGQTTYDGAGHGGVLGISQEANVAVGGVVSNPLSAQSGTCLAGLGGRYRGIGAGEIDNWVLNSGKASPFLGTDGIGYQFFSFGNVSKFANNPAYGYATINGVDPIFASYGPQYNGAAYDPGQPATAGTMPGASTLPASCGGAFPCSEKAIWAGGLSLPHVRDGSYKAWTVARVATYGSTTNLKNLVKGAQVSFVDDVPDMVPAVKTVGTSETDPGLTLLRSHFQQFDGAGTLLGVAPVNKTDEGADTGGLILLCPTSLTCPTTTQDLAGFQGVQVKP